MIITVKYNLRYRNKFSEKREIIARDTGSDTEITLLEIVTVAPGTDALTLYHCIQAGVKETIDFQAKGTCNGKIIFSKKNKN